MKLAALEAAVLTATKTIPVIPAAVPTTPNAIPAADPGVIYELHYVSAAFN